MTTIQIALPNNQRAAVLRELIMRNGVSEQDLNFNGFRMRLTELKRTPGLNIRTARKEFTTQFGKPSHYNVHYIMNVYKEQAIEVYNKINTK